MSEQPSADEKQEKQNRYLIAQRMMEIRDDHRLTQTALARVIGVSRSCVSKWETGAAVLNYDNAKKMSVFFDINIGWLLGTSDLKRETVKPKAYSSENMLRLYDVLSREDKILVTSLVERLANRHVNQ